MRQKLELVEKSLVRLSSTQFQTYEFGFLLEPNTLLTSFNYVKKSSSHKFQVISWNDSQVTEAIFQGNYYERFDLAFLYCPDMPWGYSLLFETNLKQLNKKLFQI